MKRLTIGLFALGFCSASLANDYAPSPINYFDGFYLGIGAGMSHTYAKDYANVADTVLVYVSKNNDTNTIVEQIPAYLKADLGDINGAGNIFAGWGKAFNNNHNGYFGVELFGRYAPSNMSTEQNNQDILNNYRQSVKSNFSLETKLSNDYSFGGDIRLGYLITTQIMIYALAGIDIGKFSYEVNHYSTLLNNDNTDLTANSSGKADIWRYGFMPGIGIETMLSDKVSVRTQYTYTYFGNVDASAVPATSDSTSQITSKALLSKTNGNAHSIQRGLFTVDLTYRFRGV
jgi:opacity protein-like surface antigen